jgi:hypothetical protein
MKLNLLKGFAAVAMLCMIGAVFAESVAVGDIGAAYYIKYKQDGKLKDKITYKVCNKAGKRITIYGADTLCDIAAATAVESETLIALTALSGVGLVAVGVTILV